MTRERRAGWGAESRHQVVNSSRSGRSVVVVVVVVVVVFVAPALPAVLIDSIVRMNKRV